MQTIITLISWIFQLQFQVWSFLKDKRQKHSRRGDIFTKAVNGWFASVVKVTLLRKRFSAFTKKLIISFPEIDHILWMFFITYCQNKKTGVLHFIYFFKSLFLFSLPLFEFFYLVFSHNYLFLFIAIVNIYHNSCCICLIHCLLRSRAM